MSLVYALGLNPPNSGAFLRWSCFPLPLMLPRVQDQVVGEVGQGSGQVMSNHHCHLNQQRNLLASMWTLVSPDREQSKPIRAKGHLLLELGKFCEFAEGSFILLEIR